MRNAPLVDWNWNDELPAPGHFDCVRGVASVGFCPWCRRRSQATGGAVRGGALTVRDGPGGVETRVVTLDAEEAPDGAAIIEAGALLRAGWLVAFPTETVYGLGANALDEAAVRRIFAAKERDPDDPLIVHIAIVDDISGVAADVPPVARELAKAFWPGGLTMVLPRGDAVAPAVSAGRATVAVRMPSHPVARALIAAAGVPVAAPSANRFMRTSATTARHVLDDLDGRIAMVLDAGPATAGIESTVVAVDGDVVTLLRPGAVAVERLEAVLGRPVRRRDDADAATRAASPGMLSRHYAPRATLMYLPGAAAGDVVARAFAAAEGGQRVGLLVADDDVVEGRPAGLVLERLGPAGDLDAVASRLFAALRALDGAGVEVIYARGFGSGGAGLAIDDRLRRAATPANR